MGYISIPDGAEAVFRLTVTPSFDPVMEMKMWGTGKEGWLSAHRRGTYAGTDLVLAGQRLQPGQWRTLINHINQSNFWGLSERSPETDFMVLDGSEVTPGGRQGEREHCVCRHENLEPGLARAVNFMLRASTLLEQIPGGTANYPRTVNL